MGTVSGKVKEKNRKKKEGLQGGRRGIGWVQEKVCIGLGEVKFL